MLPRVGGEIAHPLVIDVVGPARLDETVEGAVDQDVAQMKGIENAGITDRGGRVRWSAG